MEVKKMLIKYGRRYCNITEYSEAEVSSSQTFCISVFSPNIIFRALSVESRELGGVALRSHVCVTVLTCPPPHTLHRLRPPPHALL